MKQAFRFLLIGLVFAALLLAVCYWATKTFRKPTLTIAKGIEPYPYEGKLEGRYFIDVAYNDAVIFELTEMVDSLTQDKKDNMQKRAEEFVKQCKFALE